MKNRSWIYKILAWGVTTFVTSLYFFPVVFTFFPVANTKMTLAGMGLAWFFFNIARGQKAEMTKDLFACSLLAIAVSFAGIMSIIINNTPDWSYASYIISMWVWMGGAYFCINFIRSFHGKATSLLVANYIIAVGVFQCISTLLIQFVPSCADITSRLIADFAGICSMAKLQEANRLYGFGAALDPAGSRFAAILLIIGFILSKTDRTEIKKHIPLYLCSFALITIVGNMISRTTLAGIALGTAVWMTDRIWNRTQIDISRLKYWATGITLATIALSIFLYNHNSTFRKDIRFAFEGFFALVEDGHWHTNSNANLKTMYVFPDNPKTWIIGDGYFDSPKRTDPYYTGKNPTAFYKGTDVGYCRFLFYFGIVGLALFSIFIITAGYYCSQNKKNYALLFTFLALLNFIVWFKVSTDIFLVFALFLCLSPEENEEYET